MGGYTCSTTSKMVIKIRENSWFAKIAARRLKTSSVAMVLGNTIHLWGASKQELITNTPWCNHELKHVEQFLRYGFLNFLLLYLIESLRHGYYNNRFEKEARAAEQFPSLLSRFIQN